MQQVETFRVSLLFSTSTTYPTFCTAGTYPLELVKTRMQVIEGTNSAYNNFFSASASILRKEGVAGFYKGIAPAMIGASGSWGGYFYFYELSKVRKLDRIRSEGKKLQVIDHVRGLSMLMITFLN